jgi:hypothetical protein
MYNHESNIMMQDPCLGLDVAFLAVTLCIVNLERKKERKEKKTDK